MTTTFGDLRSEAEKKAWLSLSRYKFMMFGYHAALWVNYNRLCPISLPNPFYSIMQTAKLRYHAQKKGGE